MQDANNSICKWYNSGLITHATHFMENDWQIFPDLNTPLVKKYTKRIVTARVLIFILAAICLFIAVIGLFLKPQHPGEKEDAIVLLVFFGSMCLIYLVSGFLSIQKPYSSFMVAAILTLLFLILFIYGGLTGLLIDSTVTEISFYSIIALLILAVALIILRGAIFAKKRKDLMILK